MKARCRSVGGAVRADNVLHNLCRRVRSKGVQRERSRRSRTRGTITDTKSKMTQRYRRDSSLFSMVCLSQYNTWVYIGGRGARVEDQSRGKTPTPRKGGTRTWCVRWFPNTHNPLRQKPSAPKLKRSLTARTTQGNQH